MSADSFSPQYGEEGTPYPVPRNFDDNMRARVEALVKGIGARPSDAQWHQLGQVLGRYYLASGIITPNDSRKLDAVVAKAKALRDALKAADAAGLRPILFSTQNGPPELTTLQCVELLASLPGFRGRLQESDDEVRFFDDLQQWWTALGGKVSTRNDVDESNGEGSPFVEFARLTVTALPEGFRPSVSPKSIRRRIQAVKTAAKERSGLLTRLAVSLRRMSNR